MKVAICGLLTSENLGEWLIADSLKYLIQKEYDEYWMNKGLDGLKEEIDFVFVDVLANNDIIVPADSPLDNRIKNYYGYKKSRIIPEFIDIFLKKINKKAKMSFIHKFRHFIWQHAYNYKKRFNMYYCNKFKDVDFIVVDGAGLLEYSANEYQEPLLLISEYGMKNNIPVVYNAIGHSGAFDEHDYRYSILQQALQASSVKYVSARDSLDIVQNCVGNKLKVKLLADAAFWCREAYKIELPKGKKIGVGLIRGDALLRYNIGFDEEAWINLFVNIGKELQRRNYEFFFFTNGMPVDYKLGKAVIERMGLNDDFLIERPRKASELLNTISECQALITCRMHSSIAGFSMNIPSVVLSWNKKIDKYMDIIGYANRAINLNDFQVDYIIDSMERAIQEGLGNDVILEMKNKARESVLDYIELICRKK